MVRRKGRARYGTRGSAKIAKSSPDDGQGNAESSGAGRSSKRREADREVAEKQISLPQFTPSPGLYVVATPIGNLGDMTLRALSVLAGVKAIACEDTRITKRLTDRFDIVTPLFAYHDHNAKAVRPKVLARIERGEAVALVSDAGMPLVSDPGYRLVKEVVARGFAVTVIPGASSAPSALVVSGLPTDRYLFAGFLPPRKAARIKALRSFRSVDATLVFFEAARRLPQSIADMAAVLGARPAAVARELTKKFEEVRRDTLDRLTAHYAAHGAPKGEVVVVVGPPDSDDGEGAADLERILERLLADHSLKEAVAVATAETGLPRRVVYARALVLAK